MKRILIANRGEIARRIIRSAHALKLETVAVYSEADADAPHVHEADRAVAIGPSPARDSYLNATRVLAAAREAGADAVHPGYGFLSENAGFAEAVRAAGLVWIGLAVSTDNYAILFPGLLLWGLSMAFLFLPPQRAVMSSVPPGQQGQAGGIAMSAQLLGAAIGMAISSTLYNTTGSYAVVFLSNAALAAVVLVVALLAIERTGPKPAAAG